jgi:hypothetical protein
VSDNTTQTAAHLEPVWRIVGILARAGCVLAYSEWRHCWLGRCPVDAEHLLTLYRGSDGGAELECVEGCEPDAVLRALGLSCFALWPPYVSALAA